MKKGLKKLVAGLVTSVALCLPVAGITATTTTASAYSGELSSTFDHLDFVFAELSKIKEHSQFDPWFESYWEKYYYNWPNNTKLQMYSTFYGIWYDMKNPYWPQ